MRGSARPRATAQIPKLHLNMKFALVAIVFLGIASAIAWLMGRTRRNGGGVDKSYLDLDV